MQQFIDNNPGVAIQIEIEPEHSTPEEQLGLEATGVDHSEWIEKIHQDLYMNGGLSWMWCAVKLTVSFPPGILNGLRFEESEYLGCCSYESEQDFKKDGYYIDMIHTAATALNEAIKTSSFYQIEQIANQLAEVRDWCEIPAETYNGINGVLDQMNQMIDS